MWGNKLPPATPQSSSDVTMEMLQATLSYQARNLPFPLPLCFLTQTLLAKASTYTLTLAGMH